MARVAGAATHDPYPCCPAIACRMVLSRRAEMGEPGFRHYLQMQARHRRHLADVAAAAAARKLAEVAENAAGWAALRTRLRDTQALEPLQLLLPTGPRRARPLSARRRERYRAHLLGIVAEASGMPSAGAPAAGTSSAAMPSAVSAMPGRLCALCGGGCCTRGGEQAYLSAATLRRFMDARPQLSPAEVVAAYLEHVAPAPQARSCINHTRHGCSLPRDMRSDICNRFACEPLARLLAAQRGGDGKTGALPVVLVIRRQQDHWHRAEPGLDNAINARVILRETGIERMAPGAAR
ncbi:hypothetical protein ACLB1G_21225 [Oxalobacteraceae bacterium A2-2]